MTLHPPRVPTATEVLSATDRPISPALRTALLVTSAIGALIFVIGAFVDPYRVWRAFHANWLFFATLSSAGVVFVAVQRITTARWSRAVIRFMEGYVAFLPVSFIFLLLILSVGRGYIFPWTHEPYPNPERAIYFDGTFLTIRVILTYGVLVALSLWYIYTTVRLDVGRVPEWGARWAAGLRERMRRGFRDERREIHATHSFQGRLSVILALVFGFGWTILAFDLSMGLSLHFHSTLYGWWFFMGGWLCALTLFALLVIAWRRHFNTANGLIEEVHFHDIGKLCFAFTAFWGYLTFGQYLIIWYANMPEETHFMRLRLMEPWKALTLTSVILVFPVPFFGLLSRAAKVYLPTLALFAMLSLVGMWLMRHVEVYPSGFGEVPALPFGLWEIGVFLLYAGVWGACYCAFMDAFPRMRVTLMTSPYRDEVQVPVDPETMEPLPAHE